MRNAGLVLGGREVFGGWSATGGGAAAAAAVGGGGACSVAPEREIGPARFFWSRPKRHKYTREAIGKIDQKQKKAEQASKQGEGNTSESVPIPSLARDMGRCKRRMGEANKKKIASRARTSAVGGGQDDFVSIRQCAY